MPVMGTLTSSEKSDIAYDLAKLYMQLRGQQCDTPDDFVKSFLKIHRKINQALPSRL